MPLEAAWKAAGEPTTLANARHQYKVWARREADVDGAAAPAAGAAGGGRPSAAALGKQSARTPATQTKKKKTPSTIATSGGGRRSESSAARTGAAVGTKTIKTPHQVDVERRNKEAWRADYVRQHKLATLEYADLVQRKINRRKGNSAAEVAAKYDALLAADNPERLTADVLKSAVFRGAAGLSPKKPGPSKDPAK
eukprot:7385644-Prymnesium_polylepis.1